MEFASSAMVNEPFAGVTSGCFWNWAVALLRQTDTVPEERPPVTLKVMFWVAFAPEVCAMTL